MARFRKHTEIGLRWMRCGWRLFRRNPWLLGGMSFCCAAVVGLLTLIPFIGAPLVGLLIPGMLASIFITLENTTKQKFKAPASPRLAAIKRSPRELAVVTRDESRLMQVLMIGLFCMVVVVLTNILTWLVTGAALTNRAELSVTALPRVIAAILLMLSIYLAVAALLVYALPLALLSKEPLVPAMQRSFKAAKHYVYALALLGGFLLLPLILGMALVQFSAPLAYAVGLLVGAVVLSIVVASFYCSYRTIFTVTDTAPARATPKSRRMRAA